MLRNGRLGEDRPEGSLLLLLSICSFSGVIQTRMACKGNSFEKVLKHGALFTEWYYQNDSLKGNVKDIFGEGTGYAKDRDKDTSVLLYCTLR